MPIISRSKAIQLNIPRGEWFLHTILIPITWKKEKAVRYLNEHGYEYKRHRTTTNFHRFNQMPEIKGAEYFTKILTNGVHLVFERY